MRRFWLPLLALLSSLAFSPAVLAQAGGADQAQTVSACGTPNNTPVVGNVNAMTQDTTGKLCTSASGGGGGGAVFGPTAVGSAAANPPIIVGGTANATATGTVQVNKVDSGGDVFTNLAEVGGSAVALGQTTKSASIPVTIASDQGNQPVNIAQLNGAAPSLTNPIFIANAEAVDVTGTFTNATQTTSVTNSGADGYATALLSINGTYGTATGVFEESDDGGTTFYGIICTRSDGTASETGYTSLTNVSRQWSCPVAGNDSVRIRSTAVTSGTVNARVGISAPTNNSGVVSGTVNITANSSVNNAQVAGTTTSVGNGTTDAGTQRVTLSSDSTGQVKLAAGQNVYGTAQLAATASNFGVSQCFLIAASGTNSTNCKASVGQVYHISIFNNSATVAYLHMINSASAPTCSSATTVDEIMVPANGGVEKELTYGAPYTLGISFCLTGGIAQNDNTSVAASTYLVTIYYK